MKIQNVKQPVTGTLLSDTAHPKVEGSGKGLVFSRTLSELTAEAQESRLREMAGNIFEQGKKLSEHCDVAEFVRYRNMIREFVDEIVSGGYEFDKNSDYGARGRHRYVVTVKTIDEKLDEIGKEVLSGEADNINVVNAVDDIRGLILDIFS
jgi:uncharacterized protein YaaR (DUF327 family)